MNRDKDSYGVASDTTTCTERTKKIEASFPITLIETRCSMRQEPRFS